MARSLSKWMNGFCTISLRHLNTAPMWMSLALANAIGNSDAATTKAVTTCHAPTDTSAAAYPYNSEMDKAADAWVKESRSFWSRLLGRDVGASDAPRFV